MTKPNDQAFGYGVPGDEKAGWHPESIPGLTKREYFAGLAMQGILASKNTPEDATYGQITFDAVTLADTLINELNKNK